MMDTVDKPLKDASDTRGLKRTRFAPDVEEHQRSYTPYKKAKRELNYTRMLRNFWYFLRTGRNDALISYINSHTTQEIKEFHDQFGEMIFEAILLYSNTASSLFCLLKKIPIETTFNVLDEDHSDLMKRFVRIQNLVEKKGCEPIEISVFHEKMNILLSLHNEDITNAIQEAVEKDDIIKNIKYSFSSLNSALINKDINKI